MTDVKSIVTLPELNFFFLMFKQYHNNQKSYLKNAINFWRIDNDIKPQI